MSIGNKFALLAAFFLLAAPAAQSDGISNGASSATPSGSAGGDLSGTYPNPTVAKINGTAFSLPVSVANGGTALASGTSGGVLGFTAAGTIASSVALGANSVVIGGGAGATPTAITAGTNGQLLLGVTSAAPAFASMSQDCTITNAGVMTCTGINGVTLTTAWSTYTPAVTCGAGTITTDTATGRSKTLGKTIFVEVNVNITSLGTCTGNLVITLPTNPQAIMPVAAINNTTAASTPALINTSNNSLNLLFASAPAANNYYAGGVYESQ